jgi:transcriptional regulator with XRE-family HTH domain
MKNNRTEFGLRLKEARKAKKLSGYALARLLDVEPQNVCYWEHARSWPRVETLIKISEVLEVSLDWLLKGINKKENEEHEE